MTQRANILQELNEIGSTLTNVTPQNIYSVPEGYFEKFAEQILDRVSSINANEELFLLFPALNNASKEIPYSIPDGYFNGLEERLMQAVRENADYQTANEELENISPLLNGLKRETPYSVPAGYFENFTAEINKPKAKLVSIIHRRWFRYAAAAIVVGIIATSAFLFQNKKSSVDIDKNPDQWVAKNVKKVNTDQLDELIKLDNEEHTAINKTDKPDEMKELMKDVSDKEIQDFLKETAVLDDNSLLN